MNIKEPNFWENHSWNNFKEHPEKSFPFLCDSLLEYNNT